MRPGLSAVEARRIALRAQGFGRAFPSDPGRAGVLGVLRRLGVLQMDSVNVLARSHYLPLFSRLGAYPRGVLEDLAWGPRKGLFEYWMHEASLAPLEVQPLLRWRMQDAEASVGVWRGVSAFLRSHGGESELAVPLLLSRLPADAEAVRRLEAGEARSFELLPLLFEIAAEAAEEEGGKETG